MNEGRCESCDKDLTEKDIDSDYGRLWCYGCHGFICLNCYAFTAELCNDCFAEEEKEYDCYD